MNLDTAYTKVSTLLSPNNVVLVGASDRLGSWARRALENLEKGGFSKPIYLLNPNRIEVLGRRCYRSFSDLPEAPDQLLIYVPAQAVSDVLRSGAAAGAHSATIISSGFNESGSDLGRVLSRELSSVIQETGLAVSGPNCLGTICVKSGISTLNEPSTLCNKEGPVAVVTQSGAVARFLNRALAERGLAAGYVISTGNELGLTTADYIAFFSQERDVKLIICYNEAIRDLAGFRQACISARRNGKSIIVVRVGDTERVRQAVRAHTGSISGSLEVFDAISADLGVIRADTLDHAVEFAELLVHSKPIKSKYVAALTLSGAFVGMLADAAIENDIVFPPLAPKTTEFFRGILGTGSTVGNPLDAGFAAITSLATYIACLKALSDDPNIDALIVQEELPRESATAERTERYLLCAQELVESGAIKPVVFVGLLSHSQTEFSRALRQRLPNLPFLQGAQMAMRAIDRVVRRTANESAASEGPMTIVRDLQGIRHIVDSALTANATLENSIILSDIDTNRILREYGIDVAGDTAVLGCNAWPLIDKRLAVPNESFVAPPLWRSQASGFDCTRLALSVRQDPEFGLIVRAILGGDSDFRINGNAVAVVPPIGLQKARQLIARVKASLASVLDRKALSESQVAPLIIALGHVATDLVDCLHSIDIECHDVPGSESGLVVSAARMALRWPPGTLCEANV